MKDKGVLGRLIVTCNPWFLASSVILLYGIYSVQIDSAYISSEEAEVLFSFFTLQIYELMALVSAWFFMRKLLHHDSLLLIVIVSILSLIPYLNLSQALQLESQYSLSIAVATSLLVLSKFVFIKRSMPEMNLPWKLLIPGVVILAINVVMPLEVKKIEDDASRTSELFLSVLTFYVLPVLSVIFYTINRSLVNSAPEYRSKWLSIIIGQIWFVFTIVNIVSIEYVYSIPLRGTTLVVGIILFLYILVFEIKNEFFRSIALLTSSLLCLTLTTQLSAFLVMMLFNLYLVHILLKKPWLKYLQLSLVLLPIVSMYWAETKSIQHVLPFVLIIYASLIYVHRKDSISLAVLLIISFITIASLPLINSYQLTYALWGVIGFGLFIVKKEDFVKNQLAIFTCLFCWIIFTVGFSGSGGGTSSYYIGVLMAVCFSLKAKETGGLGLYVYSAPFILTVSPTTAPLVVMVKKIPIGGLIISASFAIFAIGFVLNILKAKKLNSH